MKNDFRFMILDFRLLNDLRLLIYDFRLLLTPESKSKICENLSNLCHLRAIYLRLTANLKSVKIYPICVICVLSICARRQSKIVNQKI
jgi:hypothetical protein